MKIAEKNGFSLNSKILQTALTIVLALTIVSAKQALSLPSFPETSEQVAKRLQEKYHNLDSLSFLFFQTTKGQMTGRPKTGKGNVVFVKTGEGDKMRWNYTTPDRQVIISDGQNISMYFEKLNQMIISSAHDTQADILFSFFSAQENISDNFTVLDSDPEPSETITETDTGLKVIYLVPKNSDSQIRIIHLWVTQQSDIRRIELIDHFDTRTTITISEIRINSIAQDDIIRINELFTFTPPEGTEIIRH